MTSRGKTLISALLMDIKNDREITAQMACQAAIMGTRKLGLPFEDFRELNSVLRTEFGWSKKDWETMMQSLIQSVPNTAQIDGAVE